MPVYRQLRRKGKAAVKASYTLVYLAVVSMTAAAPVRAAGVTGDPTGAITVSQDVDYAYGYGPSGTESVGGAVTVGKVCVGCNFTEAPADQDLAGVAGNYKNSAGSASLSGGNVTANEASFFSGVSLQNVLDGRERKLGRLLIAGNALVAGSAGASASYAAAAGSVELTRSTAEDNYSWTWLETLVAGNYIDAADGEGVATDGTSTLTGGSYDLYAYGNHVDAGGGLLAQARNGTVRVAEGASVKSVIANYAYSWVTTQNGAEALSQALEGHAYVIDSTVTAGDVAGSVTLNVNGTAQSADGYVQVSGSSVTTFAGTSGGAWCIAGSASDGYADAAARSTDGTVFVGDSDLTVHAASNTPFGINGAVAVATSPAEAPGQYGAYAARGVVVLDNVGLDGLQGGAVIYTAPWVNGAAARVSSGSAAASAENGSVTIANVNGGDRTFYAQVRGAYASSATGEATVRNGDVIVRDAVLDADLYGGHAQVNYESQAAATISGAAVALTNARAGSVYGGYAVSFGHGSVTIADSTITLADGSRADAVYGAFAYSGAGYYDRSNANDFVESVSASGGVVHVDSSTVGDVYGAVVVGLGTLDAAGTLHAGDSTIEIRSTTGPTQITGAVVGGYVSAEASARAVTATGNTVSIEGAAIDLSQASIRGGLVESSAQTLAADVHTGNRLVFSGFHGRVGDIGNFETIDVAIDAAAYRSWARGSEGAVVNVIGEGGISGITQQTPATVNLTVDNGSVLKENAVYTVVAGAGADALTGGTLAFNRDAGLYTVGAQWESATDELNIRVVSRTRSQDEGGTVNNPVIGMAMMVAQGLFIDELRPQKGLFAIGKAWRGETDLNAATSVNGMSLMLGAAGDIVFGNRDTLRLAGFLEAGKGDFESDLAASHAQGDGQYWAAGAQATYFFDGGLYAEASVRGGRTQADANARIAEHLPFEMRYDAPFVMAHAGVGYKWNAAEHLAVTPYARYQYLRFGSDSDEIMDLKYAWDAYTMQKATLGADLTYEKQRWTWTAGAAWESVFDADIESSYDGLAMSPWDMSGESVMVHGAIARTFDSDPLWHFEADVRARFGDYEGVMGMVTLIRQW